jgi:hypothetical protein
MTRELKPIEAIHLDQVEAASLLNAQFNDLLNSYNDMVHKAPARVITGHHQSDPLRDWVVRGQINLVSQQFLVWHQRVAKWEVQLGLAVEEPTATPAPPKKRGKATDAGKRPAKEEAPAAATTTATVPDAAASPQEAATPAAGQPEPAASPQEAATPAGGQPAAAPEAATTVATTQEEQAIALDATATEQ